MTKPWMEKWGTPHIVSAGRERHIALVPLEDGGDSGLSLGITTETYCVTRAINAANEALMGRAKLAAAAPNMVRTLLRLEVSGRWQDMGASGYGCSDCGSPDGRKHCDACGLDADLKAAGLPDRASRDAARAEIEASR